MSTIKITGKVNSAICYAKVVEEEALDQIKRMCDSPMSEGSKIRIMPDVHSGKGCTIGTTMTITQIMKMSHARDSDSNYYSRRLRCRWFDSNPHS